MKISRRITALFLALMLGISVLPFSAFASQKLVYGIGFVNATALKLRNKPSTDADVIDQASSKECVVVLGKEDEWYHVNYNLQTGYMHEDYLTVSDRENAELGYGKVTASSVNLRSGPSTSHNRVAVAAKADKCYILGINNGWYKVIYKNAICYIRSDYLELTEYPYENRDSSNSPKFFRHGKSTGVIPSASALTGTPTVSAVAKPSVSGTSNVTGAQILSKAQEYLGTPYVYGGASPSGFDCSGLVYYVLKTLGFSPYRTPADQYKQGSFVAKADLKPGDIVFFANTYGSGISHVGIYSGNGQFLHSPNSRSVVSYSDLTTGYWAEHYYGARRMA